MNFLLNAFKAEKSGGGSVPGGSSDLQEAGVAR